jgi:phage anti-repressor protein
MSTPTVVIHNAKTGKIVEREMTTEELAQHEIDVERKAQSQSEAQAKATAKAALLERLGITEDEAKLLLG